MMSNARQEALNRDVTWKGFVGLLLLPLLLATFARQIFVPIVDRGETVSVPRYMRNAAPIAFDFDQEDTGVVVSLPKEGDTYLGKWLVKKEALVEGIKKLGDRPASERIVYLRAGGWVSNASVVEVLRTIRDAGIDRVGLVVKLEKPPGMNKAGILEVKLPLHQYLENQSLKIDPLLMVVSLGDGGKLRLNNENMGDIADPAKLIAKVSEIFRERATVPRVEGASVFIKASNAIQYKEVAKLIDSLTGAGARPIVIQLDKSLATRTPPPRPVGDNLSLHP